MKQLEMELRRLRRRQDLFRSLRETIGALVVIAATMVLALTLLFPILQVQRGSMNPTVRDGDIVVFTTVGQIERGDIIAFNHGGQVLVKRVIAITGDYIDIGEDGKVQLNNKYLDEPYISGQIAGKPVSGLPRQIQDNQFFVMGDHRQTSIDSRDPEIGSVRKDQVIGKAFLRIWPVQRFGIIN